MLPCWLFPPSLASSFSAFSSSRGAILPASSEINISLSRTSDPSRPPAFFPASVLFPMMSATALSFSGDAMEEDALDKERLLFPPRFAPRGGDFDVAFDLPGPFLACSLLLLLLLLLLDTLRTWDGATRSREEDGRRWEVEVAVSRSRHGAKHNRVRNPEICGTCLRTAHESMIFVVVVAVGSCTWRRRAERKKQKSK